MQFNSHNALSMPSTGKGRFNRAMPRQWSDVQRYKSCNEPKLRSRSPRPKFRRLPSIKEVERKGPSEEGSASRSKKPRIIDADNLSPPSQPIPTDITMDDQHETSAVTFPDRNGAPLADLINLPPPASPASETPFLEIKQVESENCNPLPTPVTELKPAPRLPLQDIGGGVLPSPPGLPLPMQSRQGPVLDYPRATWHKMGLSTPEYLYMLKQRNPHCTNVMSQFNPDRRFLPSSFLHPPPRYSHHRIPSYIRNAFQWNKLQGQWESSGKHQRSSFDDGYDYTDNSWVPCSQRSITCVEWNNYRCPTCSTHSEALHRHILVKWATEKERERRIRLLPKMDLKLDPMYSAYMGDSDDELSSSSLADETGLTDPFSDPLNDGSFDCPGTPRPKALDSFDEFDGEEEETGTGFVVHVYDDDE